MSQDLIDQYLNRQALTSAVERFAQEHDAGTIASHDMYRDFIPRHSPGQDEQYAFEVDLDKCTGCKACVTACHNENGLDPDETWRAVGLLQGGSLERPAVQHVTTACHHCLEPACMSGCPTKAYEKDEATGIVRHLDDQCFGCQYCILKCPYEVPKYNKKKGIVHKCDMCVNRLSAGQAPACARACPTGAIRITIVKKEDVRANAQEYVKIPDAPASDYTYPTTRYKSRKALPTNMVAADYYTLRPEHSHTPLVVMLVLTQLSVGTFLFEFLLSRIMPTPLIAQLMPFHTGMALGIGLLALGSSILHLGRPQYAFRAVLGLKTSWLSREILSFGVFAKAAILYALCIWFPGFVPVLDVSSLLTNVLGPLVLFAGLLGVFCSVMVYKDTRRPFWDHPMTTVKFTLTMFLLGPVTVLGSSLVYALMHPELSVPRIMMEFGMPLVHLIMLLTGVKLLFETSIFLQLRSGDMSSLQKTAVLMSRHLRTITALRYICGLTGGILLPSILLTVNSGYHGVMVTIVLLMFVLCLAGELLERCLFFRAVVPLRMPGGSGS